MNVRYLRLSEGCQSGSSSPMGVCAWILIGQRSGITVAVYQIQPCKVNTESSQYPDWSQSRKLHHRDTIYPTAESNFPNCRIRRDMRPLATLTPLLWSSQLSLLLWEWCWNWSEVFKLCTDPVLPYSNTWGVINIWGSSVFSGRFALYILIPTLLIYYGHYSSHTYTNSLCLEHMA